MPVPQNPPVGPPVALISAQIPVTALTHADFANVLYMQLGLPQTAVGTDIPSGHIYTVLNAIVNRLAARGF